MGNPGHLEVLEGGVDAWNAWRKAHPRIRPDLSRDPTSDTFEDDLHAVVAATLHQVVPGRAPSEKTGLSGADLNGINLRHTTMTRTRLDGAMLIEADLTGAKLQDASLSGCVLTGARMRVVDARRADLTGATLRWADLERADLTGASLHLANADGVRARHALLRDADLFYASLVGADLRGADLTGALVYGVSAWDVDLTDAIQHGLILTRATEPQATIDDLELAQFLHLIATNHRIRRFIDTLATKVVLILGRFTPQRKVVLDAVHDALRSRGYVPVMFDFDRPATRDYTETVVTLAHLAKFIVADLTDPASLPKELEAIVPGLAVPLVPLIERGSTPYAMFADYWKYDWVLQVVEYDTAESLAADVDAAIIAPGEQSAARLADRRAHSVGTGADGRRSIHGT